MVRGDLSIMGHLFGINICFFVIFSVILHPLHDRFDYTDLVLSENAQSVVCHDKRGRNILAD